MFAVIALGIALVGLFWCFFGYRYIKAVLALIGFIAGAVGTYYNLGALIEVTTGVNIAISIVVGLIVGVLMYLLFYVSIFLIGAGAGYSIGLLVVSLGGMDADSAMIVSLVIAVVGGILALVLRRFIVIVSTAFSGAFTAMSGLALFLSGDSIEGKLSEIETLQTYTIDETWVLIAGFVLAIIGIFVQYKYTAKKKDDKIGKKKNRASGSSNSNWDNDYNDWNNDNDSNDNESDDSDFDFGGDDD